MTLKLLIIEDDHLLAEAISDYFSSKNWLTDHADNGDAAIEKFEANAYQLILLDVMLPKQNGFTICRKIRETSDVPLFFITARTMEEDKLNGYAQGADDYITKPFSLPVLYAKAMAMMGRMRGNDPARKLKLWSMAIKIGWKKQSGICSVTLFPTIYQTEASQLPPRQTDLSSKIQVHQSRPKICHMYSICFTPVTRAELLP